MGSVAVDLSHGSVMHHRTPGSHDSLIIWGIVWSLSIIKTNHRPAACRLSVMVCLCVLCPHSHAVAQSLSDCLLIRLSDFQSLSLCVSVSLCFSVKKKKKTGCCSPRRLYILLSLNILYCGIKTFPDQRRDSQCRHDVLTNWKNKFIPHHATPVHLLKPPLKKIWFLLKRA